MKTKAREFDKRFDEGADITRHLDLAKASKPNIEQRRVNVDFPKWMIERLDREADRVGVTRQSIIKMWVSEHLEKVASLH
ncbi:MAG: CopG family transcriptional regulator [Spirochaetes bacterium]|nr:CopG family transcriptional regulator [Spirochaetota bacterium]